MKNIILSFALLCLLAASARAGVSLGTSNPHGTPLIMSSGTTSGPMLVDVVSDNPGQDIMAAWAFELAIVPAAGASGTLTFHDPATMSPSNPPNYIFGGNGLGIMATNNGSTLSANDFFVGTGTGSVVPGTAGANLLQIDFLASSDATGLFGIYALEGVALTQWTDGNANTQMFTNVPNVSGAMVRIGDVLIAQVVPEPSSLVMLGLGVAALASLQCRRKWKQTARKTLHNRVTILRG
jgi:PEP-CTERM motif